MLRCPTWYAETFGKLQCFSTLEPLWCGGGFVDHPGRSSRDRHIGLMMWLSGGSEQTDNIGQGGPGRCAIRAAVVDVAPAGWPAADASYRYLMAR